MDNLLQTVGIPPWRKLGLSLVEYVLEWPFMCHAGLVLLVAWITSYLHLNVAVVSILGFLYLYQIEGRQRGKLNWKIRHEEEKKASKMRLGEGETVRWMNQALEKIWPIFLEDFASQFLLVPLTSFMDRFKPWSVKKMIVQNLSLGKTPPFVKMLRILDQPVVGDDFDDLVIEASLEWMAAEDMAAVVAVKVLRRLGFGIWTTFHICKLHLEGKVKVGLKFKDGWPVIGRVRVSFATAPYLEMAARPLYNYGVDVTELPGIASWIDRLVADALAQSLVEPSMIQIDMEKLMKDVLIPRDSSQLSRGDFWSVRASPPAADVTVEILEAIDLLVGDSNGLSDPFVKVKLGIQQKETKVKWKTLNPKWNETLKFTISTWEQPNTMLLKVRDKDHFYNDPLGFCIVDLSQYRGGKRHDFWLPLKKVDTGQIHLAITIADKQTGSHSSEDTSSNTSTNFERVDQVMSQESDHSIPLDGQPLPPLPGCGQSQLPAVASPKDRVSTRQRFKNLKPGKPSSNDPQEVDNPSKTIGRQRSGFFSSRSSRKLEMPQVGSDREKSSLPSSEYSPMTSSRLTSTPSFKPMGAEVAGQSTDDTVSVIDVGFGELGAVKICQLGDVGPPSWPSERVVGVQQSEDISNSGEVYSKSLDQALLETEPLTNIEEDGGTARKIRSAGLALHGKLHRARKGLEKDAEPSSLRNRRQELQSRRQFRSSVNGATVHLTLDPAGGESGNISSTDLPVSHEPITTAPLSVDQGGEVVCAGSPIGDRDSEKHLRNKARGLFGKAKGQLGHQFSKKMKRRKNKEKEGSSSSEELNTSGELMLMGGNGRLGHATKEQGLKAEVPLTGSGASPHTQHQLPSSSNQSGSSPSSEPPHRPPPPRPEPDSPILSQADNDKIHSSEPLRSVPIHSEQSSPTKGHELFQTGGLIDGARNS